MSVASEGEQLRRRLESRSSEELLRITHSATGYHPDSVRIAKDVLAARNVPLDGDAARSVFAEIERELTAVTPAEEPLGAALRIVCFIFCGVPGVTIAVYQRLRGRYQRSDDAWRFVAYGWGLRIVAFGLASALV